MFCSECGKSAEGKFCWNCGAPLHAGGMGPPPLPATVAGAAPAVDWQNEIDYETLIRTPAVRDLLARQKPAAIRMTGEQFAEGFGKILPNALPVPLGPVMAISQEIGSRLGIHTGKARSETFQKPVGRVIVATLCALASVGYKVTEARQATDGCVLVCQIPSDMFSLAGQLLVTVQRQAGSVLVHADASIEGQMYDWGKTKRCLDQLFGGITANY